LAELVQAYSKENLPLCVGGDFNIIIRKAAEKNNDRFEGRWHFLFNVIIDRLDLWEIEMSGWKFTWANALQVPTYEKLDRVLVSVEWEQKFPLATIDALSREISDHTPLLLDCGQLTNVKNQPQFKFELAWLLRDDFFDIVAKVWHKEKRGVTPIQKWQNMIRKTYAIFERMGKEHGRCIQKGK
jgi:hypothetical protein